MSGVELSKQKKPAQSAMEYVITYGWAILIIAVALGLLFYFISVPQTSVATSCTFTSGVACSDIILGTNATTGNTQIAVLLINQLPYEVTSPSLTTSISGQNVSTTSCIPSAVGAGGLILCTANVPVTTSVGQFFNGGFYLTVGDCGLIANYISTHTCVNPPQQVYKGTFVGHTEPFTTPTLPIPTGTNRVTFVVSGLPSGSQTAVTVAGISYPISLLPVGLLFTSNSLQSYSFASNIVISGTSYAYTGISGCGLSSMSGTITVSTNCTATATYTSVAAGQYAVTFNAYGYSGSGTNTILTVDSNSYDAAELPVTLMLTGGTVHSYAYVSPVVGTNQYGYSSISGCGLSGQSGTLTVSASCAATALYSAQYSLTLAVSGNGVTSPATGTYYENSGSGVSISATPDSGNTFIGWTGSGTGSYTGNTATATVTMDGPITETAYFGVSISSGPPLTIATPTASLTSMVQTWNSELSDTGASGGASPYTYQWLEEAPGAGSYTAISGATSLSYDFQSNITSTTGTWNFEISANDAGTNMVTSSPVSVAVSAAPVSFNVVSNVVLMTCQSTNCASVDTPAFASGSWSTYACTGDVQYPSGTQNIGGYSMVSTAYGGITAQGYQTSAPCYIISGGGSGYDNNGIIAGVAVPISTSSMTAAGSGGSNSNSITYSVGTGNFVVLEAAAAGGGSFSTVNLPYECEEQLNIIYHGTDTYVAVCENTVADSSASFNTVIGGSPASYSISVFDFS